MQYDNGSHCVFHYPAGDCTAICREGITATISLVDQVSLQGAHGGCTAAGPGHLSPGLPRKGVDIIHGVLSADHVHMFV